MAHKKEKDPSVEDAPRPYWIPESVKFYDLPTGLQSAIIGVVNPLYKDLVLSAENGLEKATGLTVVWLLWLEILDQIQLGRELTSPRSMLDPTDERRDLIARHLRLVGAKVNASRLLLRLNEFRVRWRDAVGLRGDWPEPADEPGNEPTDGPADPPTDGPTNVPANEPADLEGE